MKIAQGNNNLNTARFGTIDGIPNYGVAYN